MRLNLAKLNDRRKKLKKCDDFKFFNYQISLEDPESNPLVLHVAEILQLSTARDRIHLSTILANLLLDYSEGGIYSAFTWSTSTIIPRYNGFHLTQNRILKIARELVRPEHNLVEFHKGQRRGTGQHSKDYRSKIRATTKLLDIARNKYPDGVPLIEPETIETIILRDRKVGNSTGKLIDYQDTDAIQRMRNNLARYNKLIAATEFAIDEGFDFSDNKRPDFTQNRTVRIFNNATFKNGGRFYGGWWVNLSENNRQHILISGEPVVEVDFKNQSLVLLYAREGIHFGDKQIDGYVLPQYPRSKATRKIVKMIFTMSLNCESDAQIKSAIKKHLADNNEKYAELIANDSNFPMAVLDDFQPVLDSLKEFHPDIARYISEPEIHGPLLQNWDSNIASEVLRLMTWKKFPILGVHDSFVCRKSDEEHLLAAIQTAYSTFLARMKWDLPSDGALQLTSTFQGREKEIVLRIAI